MNDSLNPSSSFGNRLLAALPPAELRVLQPHLEAIVLGRRKPLEVPLKPIEHIYFIEHGIASVTTANHPDAEIEIGLIGREGVSGLAVVLGKDRSPHSTYMQVGGGGRRIAVRQFREALDQCATLRSIALQYAHVFMVQAAQTAAANAKGSIEERLARWVLMAHDRIDGDILPLTHEFLALMLGTTRPGVTVAVQALAQRGLLQGERGAIAVVDRAGLLERAGKFYGEPESDYERMIASLGASGEATKETVA